MRAWMLALVATLAAECTRAPSEDFASRSTSSAPGPATAAALPSQSGQAITRPGRCMLATPAEAPPAVAPGPAPGCPADPESGPPKVPMVHVDFPDAHGVGGVEAELVSSPHDTERGLMYRKSMPEEHGMLFDLRPGEEHPFWMHNTCIPLDLIYVDDDGVIVGIIENAPTLNDASRTVGCPSRYVLEVNAGWARRHGVKAGQRMTPPR